MKEDKLKKKKRKYFLSLVQKMEIRERREYAIRSHVNVALYMS